MKIAYTTTFNIEDPSSWPKRHMGLYGAGAKIIQSIESNATTVEYLGALVRKRSPITRLKWLFYQKFFQKDFYSWADPIVGRHYAHQIKKQLAKSTADIFLCPENTIPLARVKPDRPMVLWTDATLGSLIDFYPYLSNLCPETRRNLLMMERQVLERCSLVILTSQWAAKEAHNLYSVPLENIKVIPRGTNQLGCPSTTAVIEGITRRSMQTCKLLFIGVEWRRKGGDKALRVAQALNDGGIETELHVVGCSPDLDLPAFVKVHGFVDRTTRKGQVRIAELFRAAHFLIFPTRADTFGIVISEAASYGVPALASDVGGISSMVKSHITGQTFSLDSETANYCEFVSEYMQDGSRYQALAHRTFEHFQKHMSWEAAGKQARKAFEELLTH